MNAEVIFLGKHGPVAPSFFIDQRWPLVGLVGPIAWRFDGMKLRLRHIRSHRPARPAPPPPRQRRRPARPRLRSRSRSRRRRKR